MSGSAIVQAVRLAPRHAFRHAFRHPFAPFRVTLLQQRGLHLREPTGSPSLLRKHLPPVDRIANHARLTSYRTAEPEPSGAEQEASKPLTDHTDDAEEAARRKAEIEARKAEQPSYQLTFTCAKCLDRSSHRISKQGYHFGTVLVTCPGCKNRHLISDHMKIFSDRDVTIEDILKEKGEYIKKGVLGADGDVEFYDESKEQVRS